MSSSGGVGSGPGCNPPKCADIPAGTGLGSSGSFTTALLKALYIHRRQALPPQDLAELDSHIEIERLGEPAGKQDQYIAAFGGLTALTFHSDDSVTVAPPSVPVQTVFELEDRLLLFFTGFSRPAVKILEDQRRRSLKNDPEIGSIRKNDLPA